MQVHTAGDEVLKGTVRHIVLEVCRKESIPVTELPPRLEDVAKWEGCMVTSTSRLCLPVDRLLVSVPGAQLNDVHTFEHGGLADRIDALVVGAIEASSEQVFNL
jgi:branched-subunit amino acid aminotransferase/4-amino-4-deoxychorismate lyase